MPPVGYRLTPDEIKLLLDQLNTSPLDLLLFLALPAGYRLTPDEIELLLDQLDTANTGKVAKSQLAASQVRPQLGGCAGWVGVGAGPTPERLPTRVAQMHTPWLQGVVWRTRTKERVCDVPPSAPYTRPCPPTFADRLAGAAAGQRRALAAAGAGGWVVSDGCCVLCVWVCVEGVGGICVLQQALGYCRKGPQDAAACRLFAISPGLSLSAAYRKKGQGGPVGVAALLRCRGLLVTRASVGCCTTLESLCRLHHTCLLAEEPT